MRQLTEEVIKDLRKQGKEMKPCATISETGISIMLVENIGYFLARRHLIKIAIPELKPIGRKKLANALADATDTLVVQQNSDMLLLYRTPALAR